MALIRIVVITRLNRQHENINTQTMLQQIDLKQILVLDIETVPQYPSFDEVPIGMAKLWDDKTKRQRQEEETPATFYPRAGIWAEFGKIICISVGYFMESDQLMTFRIKSFSGNEEDLLRDFSQLLHSLYLEFQ